MGRAAGKDLRRPDRNRRRRGVPPIGGHLRETYMPLTIPVILGTVRRDRVGIRVARFAVEALRARGHTVTLIDPIEYPLPLLDRMYKEYAPSEAPPVLAKLAEIIKPADGYVIVSGEYNHSIPPALSNLLDHFLEEYFFKPSAIVCYSPGQFGGVRAAMQLRAMLCEMGMPSISSLLPFPRVHEALDESGTPQNERVTQSAARFFDEFEWYANALRAARAQGTPY
jgi:NAD(P)H-dependent FMN reductase